MNRIADATGQYAAPEIETLEVLSEGIIMCQSLKPGENEDGILGDEL